MIIIIMIIIIMIIIIMIIIIIIKKPQPPLSTAAKKKPHALFSYRPEPAAYPPFPYTIAVLVPTRTTNKLGNPL
jgi:hypothetical protein